MRRQRTQVLPEPQPTEVELTVLRAIRDHINRYRISPTYVEVAAAIKRAKTSARYAIKRLIAKGMLESVQGRYRNLVVTDKGLAAASNGRKSRRSK